MRSEKEWMDQHLASVSPLPFGERVAPPRRWVRAHPRVARAVLAGRTGRVLVGVATGLLGVTLAFWPSTIRVAMNATSYDIGDRHLAQVAPGVYRGDGVLVIRADADGAVAGASYVDRGKVGNGACRVVEAGARVLERCVFHIDGRLELKANDVFGRGGWERQYEHGAHVTIAASSPVPVPFPLGADY